MNLITDDWRLKLLAVALGVLMLGAVAFSQNPPTTKTLTGVGLTYAVPPGLILINPPSKTAVTISGLANLIAPITSDNMVAVVDATHASPGPEVRLNITAKAPNSTVTVQNPPPIAVNIDARQTKDLPVQVIARAAPGWRVTKAQALCPGADIPNPCTARYDGPATWEINLTASVTIAGLVSVGTIDSPNQNIQLQNSNGVVDTSCRTTVPCASLTPIAAAVHIEAVSGSTSSTVPLVDASPVHGPPPAYQVSGVSISPITVIVTGDPAVLGRLQRILLPALDLTGHTSTVSFQVAIPYPPGVDGNTNNATVTYTIVPNPSASPVPSPSP
jgi:hypothetical protein